MFYPRFSDYIFCLVYKMHDISCPSLCSKHSRLCYFERRQWWYVFIPHFVALIISSVMTLTHPRKVPPRPMASLMRFYTRLGSILSVYGKQSRPLLVWRQLPRRHLIRRSVASTPRPEDAAVTPDVCDSSTLALLEVAFPIFTLLTYCHPTQPSHSLSCLLHADPALCPPAATSRVSHRQTQTPHYSPATRRADAEDL